VVVDQGCGRANLGGDGRLVNFMSLRNTPLRSGSATVELGIKQRDNVKVQISGSTVQARRRGRAPSAPASAAEAVEEVLRVITGGPPPEV